MNHVTLRATAALGALVLLPLSACSARQTPENATAADQTGESMSNPTVLLSTSLGDIRLELFAEDAPVTVANFLGYVESGFYKDVIFHRVIPGFMIQGGGHTANMAEKANDKDPIQNESDNGQNNLRGTISMARTGDPHSARAQFFINLVDNAGLDFGAGDGGHGYAVFGKVIDGMDVVDAIAAVKTGTSGPYQNVPVEVVVITAATVED
jgi:cyclophilin family peptidyl-prolyl cis-trans isomerase